MPQALYLRIAEDLEDQIKSGSLAEGSQLPTEAELIPSASRTGSVLRPAITVAAAFRGDRSYRPPNEDALYLRIAEDLEERIQSGSLLRKVAPNRG